MASGLRPLGLGEIVDRASAAWRTHWRLLFLIILPFQLVEYTVVKVATSVVRTLLPGAVGDAQAATAAGLSLGVLVVSVVVSFYVSQIAGVSLTHVMYPRLVDWRDAAPADPVQAIRFGVSRLWPTTVAFLLGLGWLLVVGTAVMIPAAGLLFLATTDLGPSMRTLAVAGGVGWLVVAGAVLVVWFIIRFVLVSQVVAIEPVSGWRAFRRSGALASGRVGAGVGGWVKARLTVLLTVVGGILLVVSVLTSLPSLVLGLASGATFAPGNTADDVVPQAILVPVQLAQVVVGATIAPLYDVFKVVFYVDMQVRREGLDLSLSLAEQPVRPS